MDLYQLITGSIRKHEIFSEMLVLLVQSGRTDTWVNLLKTNGLIVLQGELRFSREFVPQLVNVVILHFIYKLHAREIG